MRFPADDIWKVRLGEQTRLTFPVELRERGGVIAQKPCPFEVAGFYVLERVVDVVTRSTCGRCKGRGHRQDGVPCQLCGGFGERVVYSACTERVDGEERAHVLTRDKIRPVELTDAQALEEGWESAEEWLDWFLAFHDEPEWAWTVTFVLSKQVPQYMARQHGIKDPPQYVTTPERALDEVDSPSGDDYRGWAEAADAQLRTKREIARLEKRRQAIDDKIAALRRKAA